MESALKLKFKRALKFKKIPCFNCDSLVSNGNLKRHYLHSHGLTLASFNSKLTLRQTSWCKGYQANFYVRDITTTCMTESLYKEVVEALGRWVKSRRGLSNLLQKPGFLEAFADALITHPLLGYSFDDINIFRGNRYNPQEYQELVAKMMPLIDKAFDEILRDLRAFSTENLSISQCFSSTQSEYGRSSYREVWHEVNTLDPIDAERYIGYLVREYEDTRYGTLPLYDDYGDEAWPDQNPWGE